MDQERIRGEHEFLGSIDQKVDGSLSRGVTGVNGPAINGTVVSVSGEKADCRGEDRSLGPMGNELDSSKGLKNGEKFEVQHVHDQPENCETLKKTDQGTSNSARDSVNDGVHETLVVIGSAQVQNEALGVNLENKKPDVKYSKLGLSKVLEQETKKRLSESHKDSSVIDINCGTDKAVGEDGEKVCRICHLSSGPSADVAGMNNTILTGEDLIQLGCVCKDELGIAHSQCAEAWFKLKGNRLCEICGETAKNVAEVGNNSFMEDWNDRILINTNSNSAGREGRCWRGQPFCNFLMACLVIAFVLPWFFRVNMF